MHYYEEHLGRINKSAVQRRGRNIGGHPKELDPRSTTVIHHHHAIAVCYRPWTTASLTSDWSLYAIALKPKAAHPLRQCLNNGPTNATGSSQGPLLDSIQ